MLKTFSSYFLYARITNGGILDSTPGGGVAVSISLLADVFWLQLCQCK